MGIALRRIKGRIYWFVIVFVTALVGVRIYHGWQGTKYLTEPIKNVASGVQFSLSYPSKFSSLKTEALYPLTLSFVNPDQASPSHTYEFVFESPTLIFTDSNSAEIDPRIQISNDHAVIEKTIYIHSFLAQQYPGSHRISLSAFVDGEKAKSQPDFIEIKNEPYWFSFTSLFATSIIEISVVLGLVGLIVNFIGNAQEAQKELLERRKRDLQDLASLPILEQARQYVDLEQKCIVEHWDKELTDELHRKHPVFKEAEFLHNVAIALREGRVSQLTDLVKQYNCLFGKQGKNYGESINALARMIAITKPRKSKLPLFLQTLRTTIKKPKIMEDVDESPLSLVTSLIKLWDNFDTDVKDLMVAALSYFPSTHMLSELPKSELQSPDGNVEQKKLFDTFDRRRLLRSVEVQGLFPQLDPPPPSYEAVWRKQTRQQDLVSILDWLRQHSLANNPFGCDIRLYPSYPQVVARPDQWESFVVPLPQIAVCLAAEDVCPLGTLLREESLFLQKNFPILIFLHRESNAHTPLATLAHAAARTWLDILPFSPDALLDMSVVSQQTLLELLLWFVGAKETLINILQQKGLKDEAAGGRLKRKIAEATRHISSTEVPADQVLMTWLGIRPPHLKYTILILCLDNKSSALNSEWCEHFSSFIPELFQRGIITKALAPFSVPFSLPLPEIQLSWHEERLKQSLNSLFDAALDPERKALGVFTRFHELFGPGSTEERTTEKLISASHYSLACMLTLGNHLLHKHCEQKVPETYLSPEELEDILK